MGSAGGLSFDGGMGGKGDTFGCSADLQHVVDGNGTVIETCWPDGGCSNGECVAPCTAAADSHGNVGCDFDVATPHFYVGIKPPCFAVFVANNWPKPANITVERGGQSYDVTQFGRIPDGTANAASWGAVPAGGLPAGEVAGCFCRRIQHRSTTVTC